MRQPLRWAALLCLTVCLASGIGKQADELDPILRTDFARLQRVIQPDLNQSSWRDVNWLTDVTAARARAARENKPILVFMAADGSPLGRT